MGVVKQLEGVRFGDLTVLSQAESRQGRAWWLVACSCGNQLEVRSDKLLQRKRTDCSGPAHRETRFCEIEGCGSKHLARGWCMTHYWRWYVHGDPAIVLRRGRQRAEETRLCELEGCREVHRAQGFCERHYQRFWTYGNPLEDRSDVRGEANPNWRAGRIGYSGIHMRIRRALGPAKEHLCTNCGNQAYAWSYRHGCPEEQTDKVRGYERKWCHHQSHYIPRCRSCHAKYDLKYGRKEA